MSRNEIAMFVLIRFDHMLSVCVISIVMSMYWIVFIASELEEMWINC